MAYYGVGLDVAVKKMSFEFRLALKKKSGLGIKTLASVFREADANHNGKLDSGEFETALARAG